MNTVHLLKIQPQSEIETLILTEMLTYLTEDETFHISSFMDDFIDNTKSGTEFENLSDYNFSEEDIENFCQNHNIDTDWETEQILTK